MNQEQFQRMRKFRKQISILRAELNTFELETSDNAIREAEELLASAIDVLDGITEGDWL